MQIKNKRECEYFLSHSLPSVVVISYYSNREVINMINMATGATYFIIME